MKKTTVTTNKSFDYLCDGNDHGTIDTGYGIYSFILNEDELKLYDGTGLCLVIDLENDIATIYYKDKIDLTAALNIL